MWVEAIGPKLSLHDSLVVREKTLWELYAYTPSTRWVTVMILLDASSYRPRFAGDPGVTGNFNAWDVPMPMTLIRDDMWQLTIGSCAPPPPPPQHSSITRLTRGWMWFVLCANTQISLHTATFCSSL